jgi:hypothetical protein
MRNRFPLLVVFLAVIIILFPSAGFSALKAVRGEYCDEYSGDMKNKQSLLEFKKFVSEKAKEDGLRKTDKETRLSNTNSGCILYAVKNYLKKVMVVSHTEKAEKKGRRICEKVKITFDPAVINKYLSQESCIQERKIIGREHSVWCNDIDKVLVKKRDKINIGLIIETKIQEIEENKKELLEKEEEKQFLDMVESNKNKYNVIDRESLHKILEEQKISLDGITDSDILQVGKRLKLDVIVHRIIDKNSRKTKVRRIVTGKVLLFNTYRTIDDTSKDTSALSDWVQYSKNEQGATHLYKRASIDKDGEKHIVKVLNKWIFSKEEKVKTIQYRKEKRLSTQGYDKLSHMVYLSEIDCQKKNERMVYLFLYDNNGKKLYSHTYEPQWDNISPDSNEDILLKEVCK